MRHPWGGGHSPFWQRKPCDHLVHADIGIRLPGPLAPGGWSQRRFGTPLQRAASQANQIVKSSGSAASKAAAADRAEVEARFLSFDQPRQVKFDFRVVDGRWMIANVRDQNGFDLRRTLRLPPLP